MKNTLPISTVCYNFTNRDSGNETSLIKNKSSTFLKRPNIFHTNQNLKPIVAIIRPIFKFSTATS
jgi:hypothetical protein